MNRPLVLGCMLAAILPAGAETSGDNKPQQQPASVLVETTVLQQGSLPRIVRSYGSVEPAATAQQRIVAPLSAVVGEVNVHQGQEVAAHAPLVRLVPSPKAQSAYFEARSAVKVARELVARTRKLLAQHLATGQQLADAQKSESDARSNLAALQAQGAAGPTVLKAPFRAIVTSVATRAGAIVSEGSDLLELARPDGLVLQVGIVPDEAAAIEPGQNVRITPLGKAAPVSGRVLLRGSIVDSKTGLVPVEIRLPRGKLLLGQMATAAIMTGETKGYVVPHVAILVDDKGRTYVMQTLDRVAKKVLVQVLDSNGEKDVIAGKLDAAAPVVLAGNHQLNDGMRVRLRRADRGGKASGKNGAHDSKETTDGDAGRTSQR